MSDPAIRVTCEDVLSGETETVEVPAGDYVIVCSEPCHIAHTDWHANGTHVVTIKGRTEA